MDSPDMYSTGYMPGYGRILALLGRGHSEMTAEQFIEVHLIANQPSGSQVESFVVKASNSVLETVKGNTDVALSLYEQAVELARTGTRERYSDWLREEGYPFGWADNVDLKKAEWTDFVGLRFRGEIDGEAFKVVKENAESKELKAFCRVLSDLPTMTISRRGSRQ